MKRKFGILFFLVVASGVAYLSEHWLPQSPADKFFESILATTILYAVFSVVVEEFLVHRISDTKTRYSLRKAISMITIVLILVVLLRIWIPNPQALLVAYGVVAAGIAVALQDLVKNLAGSISIFFTGSFQVGNRIKINGVVGDVIDIGLFNTTLLEVGEWIAADQATGRITTVPNGCVLHQAVHNYTKHHKYLWDELAVVVTAESDWNEAIHIMSTVGEKHTKDFVTKADRSLTKLERYYYVEGHILDPNVYIEPGADGYRLTLRYVVNAWKRRSTASNIWTDIIAEFETHPNVFIAPPTIAQYEYPLPKSK